MTKEQRQYIIHEHLFGRKLNAIAAEIGVTPQAIYNDRDRHPEAWAAEKDLSVFIKKCQIDRLLDDHIQKIRQQLREIQSLQATHQADVEASRDSHCENPKFLAILLERAAALDIAFARLEKKLCDCLSAALTKKYDLPDFDPNLSGEVFAFVKRASEGRTSAP